MTVKGWTEVSPGLYERDGDESEELYDYVGTFSDPWAVEVEHWRITSRVQFDIIDNKNRSSEDLAEAIKHAWIALRRQHPTLAAISTAGRMSCRIMGADETEINGWVQSTYFVHSDLQLSKMLSDNLRPGKQTTLHYLTKSNELVIQGRHAHSDGRGVCILFNALFDCLASILNPLVIPLAGACNSGHKLSPPLHIAAGILDHATEKQLQQLDAKLKPWMAGFPSLGVAATNLDSKPGLSAIERMVFSQEETTAIISASKKLGLTVTHTMHAAVILAAKEHSGSTGNSENYLTSGVFDLRSQCAPEFQNHPCVSYHMGWPMLIKLEPPDQRNLISTAKQVKQWYVTEKDDVIELLPTLPRYVEILKAVLSDAASHQTPSTIPHLSSMGVADNYLKKYHGVDDGTMIEVKDYWLVTETATPDLEMFCFSFLGQINLIDSYNAAYHTEESMLRYLALVKKHLFQGLGLPL